MEVTNTSLQLMFPIAATFVQCICKASQKIQSWYYNSLVLVIHFKRKSHRLTFISKSRLTHTSIIDETHAVLSCVFIYFL